MVRIVKVEDLSKKEGVKVFIYNRSDGTQAVLRANAILTPAQVASVLKAADASYMKDKALAAEPDSSRTLDFHQELKNILERG